MVQFQVTPGVSGTNPLSLAPPIVNTAWLTDTQFNRSASGATIINGERRYLPIVARKP